MPYSARNIRGNDFVPDVGGVLTALMPNGYEDPEEYPVAAAIALGWLASVVVLGITAVTFVGSLTNMTFGLAGLLDTTVFGVQLVPYFLFVGVIFASLVHLEVWEFTPEQENLKDDATTMVLYDTVALLLVLITGTAGLARFAEAALFTVAIIGIGSWLIGATKTRLRG